jgi:D-sedoheptulose 7-phosphate isomerase
MNMSQLDSLVDESIRASIAVKQALLEQQRHHIARAAELMADCYRKGGKTIFFGNGGSAADAQHLAAEMECRYMFDRAPLASLALSTNTSAVTAISNDYSYNELFARLLRAHARPGDCAIALSTSGTSKNVLAAARLKAELGISLIALTGENSGPLAEFADVVVAVPSKVTGRVQECHILIGHILCEWTESQLFSRA